MCQACLMKPNCTSTLYLNQADLVLSPDMDFCEINHESFAGTVALTSSLEQVFILVPQTSNVFNVHSLGEARKSIMGSVQLELAELPDVHKMFPRAYNSCISTDISHALRSYLPFRTAVFFSSFSITLSLVTFTISFTQFCRHWKRLFPHPQRLFVCSQGHFIQILEGNEEPPPKEDNSFFLYLTKHDFLALQRLAKETPTSNKSYYLRHKPPFTQHPPRAYPDYSAPHYSETTT